MEELRESLEDKFKPQKWEGHKAFRQYEFTGINLINEVNALDPDLVLDIGCGHNRFKGHIKNLIGFDQEPFPFADLVMPIEEATFRPESVDVAMALGSVQFGNREKVEQQLARIVSWVKPGGYIVMRTMQDFFGPDGYPHQDSHYIWPREDIDLFSKQFNLTVVKGPVIEEVRKMQKVHSTRLSWWWQKLGVLKKYKINPYTCERTER